MNDLTFLFEKLRKAAFCGDLILHISEGEIVSADLHHFLSACELKKTLPVIEPEEFELKP